MKYTNFSWNAAVAAGLLVAALVVALGCPATSPTNPSSRVSTTDGSAPTEVAPPESPMRDARPSGPAAHEVGSFDPPVEVQQPANGAEDASSDEATNVPPPAENASFENWPQPQFAVVLTGRQNGYIEPCGCAGLTNQKGGLARRHTLVEHLRSKGWDVLPMDAGNQVRRYGRQAEIKFQVTSQGLSKMKYQAVAFGPDDLRLSGGELIATVTNSGGDESPFLCANARLFDLTDTHRILETGGKKIGVTAVLGNDRLKALQSNEISKTSPEEGLRKILPELEAAGCDLLVLLASADYNESRTLAEMFPQFDVVVAAAGAGEPPVTPEMIGDTLFILVGEKAMYAGLLAVYDDPQEPFRYQRVALDAQWDDSDFMLKLLAAYQDTLKNEGLDGLGLRPIAHPSGREFVGSATCGECHTQAYEVWQSTPHHHATESLVNPSERTEIPRHHDPECLSCHVTGWDPQGFFPYKSGYLDLKKSTHLHGNGCENCHGPGSQHVAAEMGEIDLDVAAIEKLRQEMRLPLAQAEKKCQECHDLDNDPNFQKEGAFAEYWEQIKHYGKD